MTTVDRGVEVRTSKYWPYPPSAPQFLFLSLPHLEAFYGGAAGGGKSIALLMAALQYVDVPGYNALILRRTRMMLNQPSALTAVSHTWLGPTDAKWNGNDHRWTFPSGATLTFGYLDSERDKDNYQGAAYQFIGWDELTQFPEHFYTYVSFSRNRRDLDTKVPIRVRSTSNPGNMGHEWVKQRFLIEGASKGRVFVPARVQDNPGMDVEHYIATMQNLDHLTRQRMLEGDWDARPPGDLFFRDWFETVDHAPAGCKWVRYWDLAATEPSAQNPDPDWTVGLRLGAHPNGTTFVEHVHRVRKHPAGVKDAVRAMAVRDGDGTRIVVAQDPAQAGKSQVDDYMRDPALRGYSVRGQPETGTKYVRAQPVSARAEHGLVHLVSGPWITSFLDELEAFGEDDKLYAHDDQVDALSGAYRAAVSVAEINRVSYMDTGGAAPVVRRGDLVLRGEQYIDKP